MTREQVAKIVEALDSLPQEFRTGMRTDTPEQRFRISTRPTLP
jgi:hypothetical protein